MTDLNALIERLLKCTGPDRELDVEIFRVLHPQYAGPEWQLYNNGLRHVNDSSDTRALEPPDRTPGRYTASLDSALTLVPDNADWDCGYICGDDYKGDVMVRSSDYGFPNFHGRSKSNAAIALCIAALKARAQEPEQR